MSDSLEFSGTPSCHTIISENGKTYYYLSVPPQSPPTDPSPSSSPDGLQNPDEKTTKRPETRSLIDKEVSEPRDELITSGPLHYYGKNMVVKNARDMFNNVDILADGRYFCCVCNRPYKTHATLTAHLRGSHLRQESPCVEEGCNHVSLTENERKKHQKMHEKMKNPKYSHETLNIQKKIQESASCLDGPSENQVREQINNRIGAVPGTVSSVGKMGRVKYSCNQCQQSFFSAYQATRHVELHSDSPKQCFYCGEIRKGTMDLHVHYIRVHKNEGVRTITCKGCNRAFTSTILFQDHCEQEACKPACRNLILRQDIYYGELPEGTVMDQLTLNRLNFFRKRQEERNVLHKQMSSKQGNSTIGMVTLHHFGSLNDEEAAVERNEAPDIFDGSHSLIQTEFGLKTFSEIKKYALLHSSTAAKRDIETAEEPVMAHEKRERVLIAQNHYYHDPHPTTTQSQQQNDGYPVHYIHPPSPYGSDSLNRSYAAFQPMLQAQYDYYNNSYGNVFYGDSQCGQFQLADQIPEINNVAAYETASYDSPPTPDLLSSALVTDLIGNEEQDVVFEELDKLDFVLPPGDGNDNDDDLEGMFNF